jgi:hypothetical protein
MPISISRFRRPTAAVSAAAAAQDARSDAGLTRDNPAPIGAAIDAGPLRLTVRSIVFGPDAVGAILGASPMNAEPREGVSYVLVNLAAENLTDRPVSIGNDDFGLVGASGNVRRFLDVVVPTPALAVTLDPGASAEGWLAFSTASDESGLVLWFDPLFVDGDWADRFLGIDASGMIPVAPNPQPVNEEGRDPAAPVPPGVLVVTSDWQLLLQEIVRGAAVFDLVDYRTGALRVDDATGEADGSEWVALRFTITSNSLGGPASTFPGNAFQLCNAEGAVILDMPVLTPPRPDAIGEYFPGASREGWVAFDVPFEFEPVLIRFQPYADMTPALDPRFFVGIA